MQITITGPRGGGSTTLAILIAKVLSGKGMNVRYVSADREQEKVFRQNLKLDVALPKDWRPSDVTIVDGVDREDDYEVKRGVCIRRGEVTV